MKFAARIAITALLPLSGCAVTQASREVGTVVSYSSIYESPTVATYSDDGTIISTNTDLLRRYSIRSTGGYTYSVDDHVIFSLPSGGSLSAGDTWIAEPRAFELIKQVEDVLLISSSWQGHTVCVDGWETGKSRILYSTDLGILSITSELLDCTTKALVGHSVSHFSGEVWQPD